MPFKTGYLGLRPLGYKYVAATRLVPTPWASQAELSFARGDGIFADDHSVGDLCNCLSWHANAARVFSERLRIRGLIDADSSDAAVLMLGYVRTNPAHAVWHLFGEAAEGFRAHEMPYQEALMLLRTGRPGIKRARIILGRLGASRLLASPRSSPSESQDK